MNKNNTKRPVKVIGICGSMREGSYTRAALKLALKGAQEGGAEAKLLELRDYQLVFFGAMEEDEYLSLIHI